MRKISLVNCRYGAPMGRTDTHNATAAHVPTTFHLQRVTINSQGYDSGGAYCGLRPIEKRVKLCHPIGASNPEYREIKDSQKLWWYWCNGDDVSAFIDAFDKEEAKEKIREIYPRAKFYK